MVDSRFNGVLLLNKPASITSHDAVDQIRQVTGQRGVGHTGTLDPLATGLLVICLGRATRLAQFVSTYDKTYEAAIRLGRRSPTYDREGLDEYEVSEAHLLQVTRDQVVDALPSYLGVVRQRVPVHSAVKVGGKRLYELTRSGHDVQPPEREIEIKQLDLLSYEPPDVRLRITCSSGTYIRSLANDLGEQLGCGAHLADLNRTAVGHLKLEAALAVDDVRQLVDNNDLENHLLEAADVLRYPALVVGDQHRGAVVHGQTLSADMFSALTGCIRSGDTVLVRDSDDAVLAVGTVDIDPAVAADVIDLQQFRFNYLRVLI